MAALTPGQTCNLPWNTVTSSHLAIVGKLKNSAFGKDILNQETIWQKFGSRVIGNQNSLVNLIVRRHWALQNS